MSSEREAILDPASPMGQAVTYGEKILKIQSHNELTTLILGHLLEWQVFDTIEDWESAGSPDEWEIIILDHPHTLLPLPFTNSLDLVWRLIVEPMIDSEEARYCMGLFYDDLGDGLVSAYFKEKGIQSRSGIIKAIHPHPAVAIALAGLLTVGIKVDLSEAEEDLTFDFESQYKKLP